MAADSATSIPAEWADLLERRGHDVRVVAASGAGRRPDRFVRRLLTVLREHAPDVAHFHHTLPAAAAIAAMRAHPGLPALVTVHRAMTHMKLHARAAHLLGVLATGAVVANSDATLATVPGWVRRGRVARRIYNGVDLARLDAVRGPRAGGGRVRIVSVGRLIREKGFDLLLRAFADVRARSALPLSLEIIGGGEERAALAALAAELQLGDAVTLTGPLERDDVYRALWRADVFALCSRTEGFCNAAVEAMAAGLPVVVTPAGALPEVVGPCGWIAEAVTVTAVAAALRRATEASPEERQRVGAEAAARARREFSIERTLDAYEALYAELVAGKPASRARGGAQ